MAQSRQSYIADIVSACMLLSRLPCGWYKFDDKNPPRLDMAGWAFPIIGFVIGAIGAASLITMQAIGIGALGAAACGVVVMTLLSGALHDDGLADMADGFGGGRTVDDKIRIMHDSRSGPQHGHAEPKENLPKQGQHTRFPDDDATSFKNTRVPDNDATDDNLAGRCALTDTNRDLNTLSSSKPSMGSGPVDSPDLVPRNAKPSHDDISPVPDADSTSLGSPSVLLTSSQKKRLKKKKAIQAKAKLDAKAQCDSQRFPLNDFLSMKGLVLG